MSTQSDISTLHHKGIRVIQTIEDKHGRSDEADKAWDRLGALIRNLKRACK